MGATESLPFDVTLVYVPTAARKAAIDTSNATLTTQYSDELAAKKEKLFYDTLRTRLKLIGQVKPRSPNDLREEERDVIYRSVIAKLYGNESGWSNERFIISHRN